MDNILDVRAAALDSAARIMARNNQPVGGSTTSVALNMAERFERYINTGEVDSAE